MWKKTTLAKYIKLSLYGTKHQAAITKNKKRI